MHYAVAIGTNCKNSEYRIYVTTNDFL